MTFNERLIDSLQALLHVPAEFRVNGVQPTERGRIMVRNGRIKFAEFNGQTGLEAVKAMVHSSQLKVSCLQMNWSESDRDYIDECDEAVDEFLISYAFYLVNRTSDSEGGQTRALSTQKMQQTGSLHQYDVYFEAKGGSLDGTRFYLNQGNNSIGTKDDSAICIDQDTVSRRHCTVILTENFIKIRDENSTNGTRVNGTHITEAYLESGDDVILGEVGLSLNLSLKAGHASNGNGHSSWAKKSIRMPSAARETLNWSDFIKEESPQTRRNFTQMIKKVFSEEN